LFRFLFSKRKRERSLYFFSSHLFFKVFGLMIPKDKIDEVRERTSIVRLIGEYVPLKRRGSNYIGLCPFHSEKTPSFAVNEDKKIFHCFGCHETGSAITFLMKKDGMTFPEAVRELASRCGVTIKEERGARRGQRDSLYTINSAAGDYFVMTLHGSEGRGARAYLEKRGYSDRAFLEGFGLGYAPEGWSGLLRYLEKAGFSPSLAGKAGLVSMGKRGYYDRFRERLIFPITDVRGRVIGFGGRALGEGGPKYLNSPETELFKKGETLFGLSQARAAIKDRGFAIVVEGYFDLLAMHASGFTNTVATLGTALTKGHLRALRGYADSLYTLFDADEAGVKAALRGMDLFMDEDMRCRVVTLPCAKDPDEFLRDHGPGEMEKAIDGAVPLMEFFLRRLESAHDTSTAEGKAAFFERVIPYISKIKNIAERDHYVSYVATLLKMPPASLYEELRGRGRAGAGSRPGAAMNTGGPGAVSGSIASLRGRTLVEYTVLKVIINHPGLYGARVREAVEAFTDEGLRKAGGLICRVLEGAGSLRMDEVAEALLGAGLQGFIKTGLLSDDGFIDDPEKMLKDSLKKILKRGKLKVATEDMLARLESSGQVELARMIKERIGKKGP